MNFTNLFKIAVKALGNNKLRGFLTMLGIIIGVASVITMLAIGQGSKRSIQAEISEMGSNMIMIHPGGDMRGGVRLDADDMESLKLKDMEDIREKTRYVSYVSPAVNSAGQAVYGANNTPTTVYGVNLDYLEIRRYKIADGDAFSEQEIKTAAKVCLVGKTVVDELFPAGENPVGRVIRFGTIPFRIVGVLESKGYNSMGMDQDDLIVAPYTTVQKRILAITHLQEIVCSSLSEAYTDEAIAETSDILRTNHRLKATDDDDDPFAAGTLVDAHLDDRHDDRPAGGRGGHLAAGGRHRHHEHHVRLRDGAHARNRPADVDRRQGTRHSGAVPHRIDPHQRHGRSDRRGIRHRGRRGGQSGGGLPHLHPAVERPPLVRRLHADGRLLRVVPRAEGGDARPDRGDPL